MIHEMSMEHPLSAFILAGGQSTRMGADKAFVALNGRTLLQRVLNTTRSVTPNVSIVGDPAKFAPFAPAVADIFPACGPLAGIHAALRSSLSDLNLILAVDLPFVPPALLQFLRTQAESSPVANAIVPHTSQGWQPLCAIYRRSFADLADEALRSGRYKIDTLFPAAQVRAIDEDELQSAGFSAQLFRNLNTPQDLAASE
ncbi:MAG TPA: molybdenum cofactor guanylyltransferase [Candidatus Sulfotelmatobacter sp.]|nr:molybdenum cofactor guanylyltransferase [Candidatus Sulfotelmatobacter sp.]